MPNLDNLISKILSDCEEEARLIRFNAEKRASEMMKEGMDSAQNEKERLLAEADTEAKRAEERLITGKKLEIRNDCLNAKRKVIDKVFDIALNKLNNMPRDKFMEFLQKNLLTLNLDGCEIVLPSKYDVSLDELNSFLTEKGKGSVRASKEVRDINGGFILVKEGVESNYTFETLVGYYWDALESEIISTLF